MRNYAFLAIFCAFVLFSYEARCSNERSQEQTALTIVETPDTSPEGTEGTPKQQAATEKVAEVTCDPSKGECTMEKDQAPVPEIFEPSYEWKEILPGQHVPGGLHIRLNLQTGKKEAKLLAPEDRVGKRSNAQIFLEEEAARREANGEVVDFAIPVDPSASTQEVQVAPVAQQSTAAEVKDESTEEPNEEEKAAVQSDKIYQALNALPTPPKVNEMELEEAAKKMTSKEFQQELIRLWRERQAILKQAMNTMQDSATYMQKLLEEFISEDVTAERQIVLLEELEWEVQDLDKAKDFHTIGGLALIIRQLNATNLQVRSNAAWVLGTAVKNFLEAQNWALDYNSLPFLLATLNEHHPATSSAGDTFNLQKKTFYALAALLRANERAQSSLWVNNGVEILEKYHDDDTHDKLKLKLAALVYDLLQEQPSTDDSLLKQLQTSFRSSKWCVAMLNHITTSKALETKHKLLLTISQQQPKGNKHIQEHVHHLNNLANEIAQDTDLDQEYQTELLELIQEIKQPLA